ncbi:VOC family protein [Mangrovihabitans endophyticus]|uniref:VOC family protein n=1 Tax=Mangrovihabitans endophyticus TaxID=1751298 RepID=UPI001E536FE6|nr:VOC family protein [Mangrovihabitans endophyticus]
MQATDGIRWITGFLDGPDRTAEPLWRAVTGGEWSPRRGPDGAFATLVPPDGDAYLRVQVTGDGPARAHLDLHVADVPAHTRRAGELGAVVVSAEPGLTVLRSPAGLPFCLVTWHGETARPAPVTGDAGRSLVDQMCLDIPRPVFDTEADFWSVLTGWTRLHGASDEFDALVRPDGMPLRLLLQRIGGTLPGMHLDLASDDRRAEVARHLALGAAHAYDGRDWTTLRDPAGRVYCVTDRRPDTGGPA